MDSDDLYSGEDQLRSSVQETEQQPSSQAAIKQSPEGLCGAYSVIIQSDFQIRKLTDLDALLRKHGHNLRDLPVTVILLWGVVAVELQAAEAARATLEQYLATLPPGLARADAMALSRLYAVQLLAGLCQDFAAAAEWLEAGGAGLSYEQQELLLLEVDEAEEVLQEERLAEWAATQAVAATVAGTDAAASDSSPAAAGLTSHVSVLLSDEAESAEACRELTASSGIQGTSNTSAAPTHSASAAADADDAQPVDHLQPASSLEAGSPAKDRSAASTAAVDEGVLEGDAPAGLAASAMEVAEQQQQQQLQLQLQDSPYCTVTGIISDEVVSITPVDAALAADQAAISCTSSAGSTQAAKPAAAGGSSDNSTRSSGSMWGTGCSSWLSSCASGWWQSTPVQGTLHALHLQDVPPWELTGGAAVAALVGYGLYRERRRLRRAAADLAAGVVQTAQMGLGFSVVNAMGSAPSTAHRW